MRKWIQVFVLVVAIQAGLIAIFYLKKTWTDRLTEKFLNPIRETETAINLEEDDATRLINLRNFQYTISKENACANSSVLLLIVVSSAPNNQVKRQTIRETWGQMDPELKILFSMGASTDTALQEEDSKFNDIIQGNFVDSYWNMTYKSTMALKYAVSNCPTAKFVMKCDDDVFVNTPLLKNFLKNDLSRLDPSNAIFCNVNSEMEPIRDPKGPYRKWYVSYEQWPENVYPMYCSGWYAIMTLRIASALYKSAQNATFFWIDDIFLTGIAAGEVKGLQHVDLTKYTLVNTNYKMVLNGTFGDVPFLFGTINMRPDEITVLWQYVLSHSVPETLIT